MPDGKYKGRGKKGKTDKQKYKVALLRDLGGFCRDF